MACRFRDLKTKDFISTCSSIVPGNPRLTKHSGAVPRPKVAEEYLKYSASIDIHNHYRCGSAALEDVWRTHNPHLRQFSGIIGFCFTNAYLAMKHFTRRGIAHHEFKCAGALALTSFNTQATMHETRAINLSSDNVLHSLERIGFSKECYYCQHGFKEPRRANKTTSFRCKLCQVPICRPSKSECWDLHITFTYYILHLHIIALKI